MILIIPVYPQNLGVPLLYTRVHDDKEEFRFIFAQTTFCNLQSNKKNSQTQD